MQIRKTALASGFSYEQPAAFDAAGFVLQIGLNQYLGLSGIVLAQTFPTKTTNIHIMLTVPMWKVFVIVGTFRQTKRAHAMFDVHRTFRHCFLR